MCELILLATSTLVVIELAGLGYMYMNMERKFRELQLKRLEDWAKLIHRTLAKGTESE